MVPENLVKKEMQFRKQIKIQQRLAFILREIEDLQNDLYDAQ